MPALPSPLQRRRELLSLCSPMAKPSDHNSRGLFVGGPQYATNWDLMSRMMGESMVEVSGNIADAIGKMARAEASARHIALIQRSRKRLLSAMSGRRTRNRRSAKPAYVHAY